MPQPDPGKRRQDVKLRGEIPSLRERPTRLRVPHALPLHAAGWSGRANQDWARLVIEMRTDHGLASLGETLGGAVTKSLIDPEIADTFRGEDPFDLDRILAKATFVPLYHGKKGSCAIAGLELACWDLMGKATGRPVCQLLGGRLRDEIPFANHLHYRNPDASGRHGMVGQDQMLAYAEAVKRRYGFTAIKLQGRTVPGRGRGRHAAQPTRCFPGRQAALRPARHQHVRIDLETLAAGVRLGSVDVVLGGVCEWGGLTVMKKLQEVCEVFQINLNFHSVGGLGIATAVYLQIAAAQPALSHALDTHVLHLSGDVPGAIGLTERVVAGN